MPRATREVSHASHDRVGRRRRRSLSAASPAARAAAGDAAFPRVADPHRLRLGDRSKRRVGARSRPGPILPSRKAARHARSWRPARPLAPMKIAIIIDDNGTGIFRYGVGRFIERLHGRAEFALSTVAGQHLKIVDYTGQRPGARRALAPAGGAARHRRRRAAARGNLRDRQGSRSAARPTAASSSC